MKVSVNAIRFINKHYDSAGDPAPNGVDELVEKIGAQLGAVEEVIPFGKRFEGVVIVKVVACSQHPNADRLHVCKIDDGGRVQDVERDENGHVQVVCGAPNVREGLLVAWLPPRATVPSTYDKDPFVLEARELRGEMSNGMLASPKELALSDSHEGILEIDRDIAPGTLFAEAFNLVDDAVLDIENKMFTHRPDCFGWIGVAREVEGIYHRPYKSPEWYRLNPEFPGAEAEELKLEVHNELPELVPRFVVVTMRDVQIKESPVWLQVALARVGLRPINNIVDYTNFFMLATGQPLHAYDYDKVKALSEGDHATIVVRKPRAGEKILLLNGKEIEPRSEAIMIATDKQLIGVGGVMGGADTEVDDNTRNIIIECANFDMYSIRRTSMAHGLFTDAVTRFNKGQSPLQNKAVIAKIVDEIRAYAGGKIAGQLIDDNHLPHEVMERGSLHAPVNVTAQFINERLGFKLSADEMKSLLNNVEFSVDVQGDELTVTAPFWRTDIEIPEDVVEEVGRLYGFDHLPLELPLRSIAPAQRKRTLELESMARDILARAGANELLTYSFVHGNVLDKVGEDKDQAYRLSNALSPDLQYYRLSVTPSLLEKVHPNIKAGYGQFALFEMGKAHVIGQEEDDLPKEFERLALVFAADDKTASQYAGAAYYEARRYLMYLLEEFGLKEGEVQFVAPSEGHAVAPYFAEGRAASVIVDDVHIGHIGEYAVAVRSALKLPAFSAGFELDMDALFGQVRSKRYSPLSRYPRVEQDICLRVPVDVQYQQLLDLMQQTLDGARPAETMLWLSPVDIYQREDDKAHKQITVRVGMVDYAKTMTDAEVNALLDQVTQVAHDAFGAERI